ncbi:MAG: GNAT family N-acetyltransferase [Paracoccaceae bacterium]
MSRGRYELRLAATEAEIVQAQQLRHLAFWTARGRVRADGLDCDVFDAAAQHMLVWDRVTKDLVACCRIFPCDGTTLSQSYAAQFYDLARLSGFPGPMLELGRFCLHPDRHDPDILRLIWAGLTRKVDADGIALLFGCSSFTGADPARHAAALALLARHAAPAMWRPAALAPHWVSLADARADGDSPPHALLRAEGLSQMPALLRSYLSMGGWVSDHAVIDSQLDTLHVLTGVEIAAIPAARARALRLVASENMG